MLQAKKKEGSQLPEERQRYWNAYILVYESRADHKAPRTPKKSFSGTTSYRRSVGPSMQRRLTLPPRISEPGQPGTESQVGYALKLAVKECTPGLMVTVTWYRTGSELRFRFDPLENSPQWSLLMKEFDTNPVRAAAHLFLGSV
jgi:hypothetical protein